MNKIFKVIARISILSASFLSACNSSNVTPSSNSVIPSSISSSGNEIILSAPSSDDIGTKETSSIYESSIQKSSIEESSSEIVSSSSVENVPRNDYSYQPQYKNLLPFNYEDYSYDEYFNQESNAYIRLCENGYLIYEDSDSSLVAIYSRYNDYIIVENIIINGSLESVSADLLFFTLNDETITIDNRISIINNDYSISDKPFNILRKNVNENAKYSYTKEEPKNLLISISFHHIFESATDCLNYFSLQSFSNSVNSFNQFSNSSSIGFSFSIAKINVYNTIVSIISAINSASIRYLGCRFDDYRIIKSANIGDLGLSNADIVQGYQAFNMIESHSVPFDEEGAEKGIVLATKEDALGYANLLRQKGERTFKQIIDFIENLDEDVFNNNKLAFSQAVVKENSAVTYSLNNVYLKNNELFIVLNKSTSIEYALGMISYAILPLLIPDSAIFQNILTVF